MISTMEILIHQWIRTILALIPALKEVPVSIPPPLPSSRLNRKLFINYTRTTSPSILIFFFISRRAAPSSSSSDTSTRRGPEGSKKTEMKNIALTTDSRERIMDVLRLIHGEVRFHIRNFPVEDLSL